MEDTSWDVYPTYSLSIGNQTMTESEIANAILRTASDEIINGTAVYVDDQLLYVTTEGDHLQQLSGKHQGTVENAMDSSVYTAFATTSVSWTVFICRSLSAPTRTSSTP